MGRSYVTIIAGGLAIYVGVAGATFLYLRPKTAVPTCKGCSGQGRGGSFDVLAEKYDSAIGLDETLMGIKLLRWWNVRKIKEGNVLEVSAGTGRNLPYYSLSSLSSVTLSDISREMLWHAQQKYGSMKHQQPYLRHANVKFCLANAEALAGPPLGQSPAQGVEGDMAKREYSINDVGQPPAVFPPHSFDTVVDTFGLCSMEDPVKALQEMAHVCKASGYILLLEHGRSRWEWLNKMLDESAPDHHCKWGCWWNRDMLGLCKQAGLKVEHVSRYHFGTTYVIIAKPPDSE